MSQYKHVRECLTHFQNFWHLATRPAEIELAFWFHDAIYDIHRSDNEEQSAEWARSYLLGAGASAPATARIVDMILATKSHQAETFETQLMVDIDLGILGADREGFCRYDNAIREDYSGVPWPAYCSARAAVLRSFVDREPIYHTREPPAQFESAARENIVWKLNELEL